MINKGKLNEGIRRLDGDGEVDLKYIDIDLFNNGETREGLVRESG